MASDISDTKKLLYSLEQHQNLSSPGTKLTLEMYQKAQRENIAMDLPIPKAVYDKHPQYIRHMEMKHQAIQKDRERLSKFGSASVTSCLE